MCILNSAEKAYLEQLSLSPHGESYVVDVFLSKSNTFLTWKQCVEAEVHNIDGFFGEIHVFLQPS
jgi:hypothetical protein